MQIALIGWQGSGKSTLYTALTGMESSIGEQAHSGIAFVPDKRLDALHTFYPSSKKIAARVDYLDIAGLAHSEEITGFKRSMINHLQGSQLLVTVIGVFHLGWDDIEGIVETILEEVKEIEDELLLSDMGIAENRIERIDANQNRGLKTNAIELDILKKILDSLNSEIPLRNLAFEAEQDKIIRTFAFLTLKPHLIVINVADDQDIEILRDALEGKLIGTKKRFDIVNAKLESEIAILDEEDRDDFLKEMKIDSPASERVIQTGFELLNLISFFTIGDDEVRAWPVPSGIKAVNAAGEIHSDLERGFIRGEIVHSNDYIELGSFSACRDKGLLRLEGKDYIVQDGEIMHVRFAV
ncbi:MAG: DUF933 domain-containing protein [Candidatus Electryonea clarkiae]|nr:DUF933 domain-containing protein [Candidatus Electryonea clarkiae]MDP8286534.1 DUF933 domain-containing protein [Candidatus Electryonea clarkiae]